MSTITLQFVVEEVNKQKLVFIITRYNKIKIEDYYNMVIQDKININRCISQNYENLFYKYQIMKDLVEQNILLIDHINYCQMMKGYMYQELKTISQTTENEEELLDIIQEINDTDNRIYELKLSRFKIDQKIFELNNEIKKINQIIESKEKLLNRVKGLYYKVLECHNKYYSVFQDITCPVNDIFIEYMDDVD